MGGRKDCSIPGSSRVFGTSFEATAWRTLDPCGFMGVSASLSVHVFAYVTIACNLIENSLFNTAVFVLIYSPTAFLAVASLYMAFATDPGSVPLGARPLTTVKRASSGEVQLESRQGRQRALRRCHKCNDNFKPGRAHHDSVTGRCIVKFDHFCPWVGNAVGAMNHKFFVLFVGYTLCTCIVALFLIFIRAIHCGFVTDDSEDDPDGGVHASSNGQQSGDGTYKDQDRWLEVHYRQECEGWYESYSTLALLIVSVIFMIFTCCMMFEQIEAIETNTSKIARMKMRVGEAGTEMARVTEEFNEMFGGETSDVAWHWFLPLPVQFPRGMKKVVLGYEWDETFDAVPYEEPSTPQIATIPSSSAGDGLEIEREVTVEMTASGVSQSQPSPSQNPSTPVGTTDDDGEEGSFTGTPVLQEPNRPHLKQRSNSRGPDSRLKPAPGTFT